MAVLNTSIVMPPPESVRTGRSVEAIKRDFTDNLFCIQARFPAVATKNDYYQALAYTVRDRLLARCAFVEDLKPRQIVKAYPAHWKDEREVSVELYRLRRLLRNDPDLRRMAG